MSRRRTQGGGPPEEMVKKLKDDQIRRGTLRQMRSRNIVVGASILAIMGGIYIYTLRVTKQENFLDREFDNPEPAVVQRSTTANNNN